MLYPSSGGDYGSRKSRNRPFSATRKFIAAKSLRLHVDTIRQASGRTTIREVVLHPGGVTAIPVLDDGRILLIRQFRYPIGKFILELPAGKLDSGQPPLETMARELEEEIGYQRRQFDVPMLFLYDSRNQRRTDPFFYCARTHTLPPNAWRKANILRSRPILRRNAWKRSGREKSATAKPSWAFSGIRITPCLNPVLHPVRSKYPRAEPAFLLLAPQRGLIPADER